MDIFYPKNLFIPQFFNLLWDNPEIVAYMLMDSNPPNIEKTLIPLIGNNFYENILSSKYLQNNLIYTIGLLLKNEINNLSEKGNPEDFLNKISTCRYILYELRTKNDSQIFIKKVIEDLVGKIDEYQNDICFDIKKINDNINKQIKDIKNEKCKKSKTKYSDNEIIKEIVQKRLKGGSNFNKDNQLEEEFNNKYMKEINLDNEKNEFDKEVLEYYNNEIIKRKNSFKDGMNKFFNESINEYKYKNEIILLYQNDFYTATYFIDSFLNSLLHNISIIPYSIKAICKTISLLIEKKFPNISKIRRNAFVSRYFFYNQFWPILQDSSFGALIDNYIIPPKTMDNLKILMDIFIKFIMGKLFDEKEKIYLSPFNKFFIEKMPDLINFIDNLIDINLPNYLENVINDKNDYKFDIYIENQEDIFFNRAICFKVEDIQDIIIHVQKNIGKIKTENSKKFIDCFNKILDNSMGKIIFKIKKEEEKNNKLYYFLLTDNIYLNERTKKVFKYEQLSKFFEIKRLDNPKNDEEKNKNLIIKIKNFISAILYKFIILTEEYFPKDALNNINDIFKELLNKSQISNYITDDDIPAQWYVKSILECLPNLPEDLKKNNCKKLLEEMIDEINLSIKDIDLETLTTIRSKLSKSSIHNPINSIKNIDLNKKVESIINSEIIEVGLSFHYDGEHTIFNVVQEKSILDFNIIDDEDIEVNIETKKSKTISEFIKNFPDFTIYQRLQDVDILEFENKLHVRDQIFNYLKIINNYLKNKYNYSKEELSDISGKIYDYIMLKLYDKLFPPEPSDEENQNYKNTIFYSWTESKHFIKKNRDSTFNSFLPDVIKYLKLFIKEKSPRKKIDNVSNAFKAIERVIRFNGLSGLLGVDDFMAILNYSYIKTQPYRMLSNIKYAMLYDPNHIKGSDSQLTQLLGSCDFITQLSFESLYNITKEEFDEKMKYK